MKDKIVTFLREYAKDAGKDGYVVGLSGGVDSAVAAALAVEAVGKKNVQGLIMPCHSQKQDQRLARRVAMRLGIRWDQLTLDYTFDALNPCLPQTKMARGNAKARLRMIVLYAYASGLNLLVLGTGNRSELEIGYFTKYGDGGVDVLPLKHLYKYQVYELARELDVPSEVIDRPPSAGLWAGQTDEGEMGLTYEQLDRALEHSEGPPAVLAKVRDMVQAARHKLTMPPGVRDV